jgi:uncharacterized membrane protein
MVKFGGCVPVFDLRSAGSPAGFAAKTLNKPLQNPRQSSPAGRLTLSIFFAAAGVMHFVFPNNYVRIVPPILPAPALLVLISGIAEIAGALGLLLRVTQRAAAWGLILLLVAVFPANIYTAVAHLPFPGLFGKSWAQWLRLPFQIPLIYWTWRYTRR